MKLYELALIISPDLSNPEIDKKLDQIRKKLTKVGKIKEEDIWGIRDLAYRIKLKNRAFYAIFYVETESGALDDLDAELRIDSAVLRYLIMVHELDYTPVVRLDEEGIEIKSKSKSQSKLAEKKVMIKKEGVTNEDITDEETVKSKADEESDEEIEAEKKVTTKIERGEKEKKIEKDKDKEEEKVKEEALKKKLVEKKKSSLEDLDAALDELLKD